MLKQIADADATDPCIDQAGAWTQRPVLRFPTASKHIGAADEETTQEDTTAGELLVTLGRNRRDDGWLVSSAFKLANPRW
jgi:hypothetical protein